MELYTRDRSILFEVLTHMRRSAGLLMALFASHLTMVAGGVVCVVPGMEPMAGAATADASSPMAAMPGMGGMTADNAAAAPTFDPMADAGASTDEHPCSGPASGTCTAVMPCITALGAGQAAPIARPPTVHGRVRTVAVAMPASSAAAPDIPPPRA